MGWERNLGRGAISKSEREIWEEGSMLGESERWRASNHKLNWGESQRWKVNCIEQQEFITCNSSFQSGRESHKVRLEKERKMS